LSTTFFNVYFYHKECIKPVKVERKEGKVGKIRIDDDGSYTEISAVSFFL